MKRELGPWVWCQFCTHGRFGAYFCTLYKTRSATTGVFESPTPREVKHGGQCAPRLTLTGRIRRALGLPIGEESE